LFLGFILEKKSLSLIITGLEERMSRQLSRKRKNTLKLQAKKMREAKVQLRVVSEGDSLEESSASAMNESLVLPAPTDHPDAHLSSESSTEDEDYEVTGLEEEMSGIYKDWLDELEREDLQMISMMMYDNYLKRFGLLKTSAAKEVALCLNLSEKTVRVWRKEFLNNRMSFEGEKRGIHQRHDALDDEEYHDLALEWVRSHAFVKGKPNMTAADFSLWLNSTLLPKVLENHPDAPHTVSVRTARRWLHKLGFEKLSTKKGVYIDGHERQDVVEYRKLYLRKLEILSSSHAPPPLCSDEDPTPIEPSTSRKLVLIFHDESTFHSNEDQGWMWGEKGKVVLKPKGQGRGIMVSDFIDEHFGFLALTDDEFVRAKVCFPDIQQQARTFLKYGAENEGYWNSDKFLEQVKAAIKIAKYKYNSEAYNVVWLFDHSSGHTAFAENALNVNRMNVKPGGKQAVLRDTVWNGRLQKMVQPDGTSKGMKLVLQERGINVTKMKADDMRSTLQEMHDFKYEKTKLETLLTEHGYRGFFIPKFHCELNPIERVWAQSKQYTRAHCDYSFKGLEDTIGPALDSVTVDMIRKFFRKMRDYLQAYREGHIAGPELEKAIKTYKSHRRIHVDDD